MSKFIQDKSSKILVEMQEKSKKDLQEPNSTIRSLSTDPNPHKESVPVESKNDIVNENLVSYYGKIGDFGEFEGRLIDDYPKTTNNYIITSKEDVYKYVNRKSSRQSERIDDGNNLACQQCLLQ
ncbi:hypothetical protein SteCoe_26870 [Stentor coeruleus]|uniref:Uncharacterized protein n=1 Tax=Stentor coeruleus TaxID=5963 RepID=A0A1R2BBV8_9CILI|nr:hypothetical protein SteCoe_26870 [Stentor coeruleus]